MLSYRMLVSAVAVALCLVVVPLQPAAATSTEAGAVTGFAEAQLGKPYRWAETGLRRYDCSGLVYRTFYEKGLLDRIGSKRRSARGYYRWFRDRGLLTTKPQPGDLVAWGRPVSHIGIFVGYDSNGKPLAISSLTSGVSRHRVDRIGLPLKAYLKVSLQR